MTKIMLVEDDKSLREIYGVRLLAEGYDIVSAGDGEEALAMAIKERPGLIISDVMMPKVSGYDMLDILRSTTETKNIRVIMMTALSSEEQRQRAESLGADRYLVKSQVGIEDVVRVVHEILEDTPTTANAAGTVPTSPVGTPAAPTAVRVPVTPPAAPTTNPSAPQTPVIPQPAPVPPTVAAPIPAPVQTPSPLPAPGTVLPPKPVAIPVPTPNNAPKPASLKTRIIQPLTDPSIAPININDLLDKELAKEAGIPDNDRPAIASIDQEKAELAEQLNAFVPADPTPVAAVEPMTPTVPSAVPASSLPTPGISSSGTVPNPGQPASVNPMTMPSSIQRVEINPTAGTPAIPTVPAASIPTPPVPPAPTVPLTPVATPSVAPVMTSPLPAPTAPAPQPVASPTPLAAPGMATNSGPTPVTLPEVPRL